MKLKQALTEYNQRNPKQRMTQQEFGRKYYGTGWKPHYKAEVSKMMNGKKKIVDVAKCAKILGTSTDYILGLTNDFNPCYDGTN